MKVKLTADGRGGGHVSFSCPGCGDDHVLRVSGTGKPAWRFNGDTERPTLTPSILVRTGHHVPEHKSDDCWCTYYKKHPEEAVDFECYLCHSFVTDGSIQFLSDCTHALAGKTVPLPELPT